MQNSVQPLATLEPVRFGEFLLHRNMISDEQWLAALAAHWSGFMQHRFTRIGTTIVENGFLDADVVEREACAFHDGIDVVEVGDDFTWDVTSSERATVPPPFRA
jgi:hypothetical protein